MLDLNVPLLKPILILEDEPHHQARISGILKNLGYQNEDMLFAQTITAAVELYQSQSIKFLLVDLNLPDGNGIDFIERLKACSDCDAPIMVLSAWNALDVIYQALHAGATGYVVKEKDDFELMFSIRTMLKGGAIIDPAIAKKILKKFTNDTQRLTDTASPKHNLLSPRESEILCFVGEGLSNIEIASELHISKFTVQVHIKNIYQKLEVHSRTKAVQIAKNLGVLQ